MFVQSPVVKWEELSLLVRRIPGLAFFFLPPAVWVMSSPLLLHPHSPSAPRSQEVTPAVLVGWGGQTGQGPSPPCSISSPSPICQRGRRGGEQPRQPGAGSLPRRCQMPLISQQLLCRRASLRGRREAALARIGGRACLPQVPSNP